MASSVEWTAQMEEMYDSGARVFIEVGPKRALRACLQPKYLMVNHICQ